MQLINENDRILIIDMIDSRGYTLMHIACFKNYEELALKFMERAYQTADEKGIKAWINLRTDEDGFTALHFASFRGNLTLIKMLMKYGADMHV